MSGNRLSPSVALLRSFRQVPIPKQCLRQIPIGSHRAIHSSRPLSEEQKDFKGQLFESTTQRLQRERAEQRRFAKERGEHSGGRNAAITFGIRFLHRKMSIAHCRQWSLPLHWHATTSVPSIQYLHPQHLQRLYRA